MDATITEMRAVSPSGEGIRRLDEAFAYCARITAEHYENFPVASLFLPAEKRAYIQSIYAFSRTADDFADEGVELPGARLKKLEEWEDLLSACYEGEASHPIFIALRETVQRNDIPHQLLVDLLSAFRQDVVQQRYATFEELLSYCTRSANPVGRIVLRIFGYREDSLFGLSDNICTALQLANFWQDISLDRAKDRLYIPLEDLERFGVPVGGWRDGVESAATRELMKFQVERTKELFWAGSELPARVDRDLHVELKLVWLGGMAILRSIEKSGFRTFSLRPILGTFQKMIILSRALFINDLTKFGKKKPWWDLTP
jgi:squalene synthase HpnC